MPSASSALRLARRAANIAGQASRMAGGALLDALLPPHCLTCDQPVGAQGQLCAACFRQTVFIGTPCCNACGTPFAAPSGAPNSRPERRLCEACETNHPPWERGRAALLYDDQARRLLMPFKYNDRTELAQPLATMMARAGAELLARADLVIPVPLHRRRLAARRYNQAALLAAAVARLGSRPAVLDGLLRTRPTIPLGALPPDRRAAVLQGAFTANPARLARLQDARILLIDDILTTGATADACTTALLRAGAGGVDVLAAARVPAPGST